MEGRKSEGTNTTSMGTVIKEQKRLGTDWYVTEYDYDLAGRVKILTYPYLSGTASENCFRVKYDYDDYSGGVKSIKEVDEDGNVK